MQTEISTRVSDGYCQNVEIYAGKTRDIIILARELADRMEYAGLRYARLDRVDGDERVTIEMRR